MDDELSERARKLVEVAMAQDVPPSSVVDDSWGMVVSRVTADTERASASPPVAAAAQRSGLRVVIAIVVVAAIGGGAWLALRPAPVVAPAPAPVRVATPAVAPAKPVTTKPATARMLDDAEAALATAPARALELVDRHAELAPTQDAERRMALRIAVLCALGRVEEARAEATAFLAEPRAEAWRARVRASCGGAPP
ncbi:MAG TPA: hypothetical protein VG755_07365 [Nannocystaceae bacterium]|nr:hypothetical protein [Nannocystaceae bacterium]